MPVSAATMSSQALRSKHYSARPSFPSDLEVLVVESNKTAAEIARKVLTSCNYRVTICKTCVEAVAILARKAVDVVMVEIKLFSAQEAGVNQLKAVSSRIPIVLVSDVGSRKDVWSAIAGGAADVVSKPLSRPKIQTLWQHLVRKQGACMASSPSTAVPLMSTGPVAALAPAVNKQTVAVKPELPVKKMDVRGAIPQQQQPQPSVSDDEKSRKRKAKDVSGGVGQSPRPLLAVKASAAAAVPSSMAALALPHAVRPVAHVHPHHASGAGVPHPHASVMGYWGPQMMAPPTMIPGHPHMSWGTPVMGVPAGHGQPAPGLMAAPHGWVHPQLPGAPHMIAQSRGPVAAAPASGAMAIAQPLPGIAMPAASQVAAAAKQEAVATPKAPTSPAVSRSHESMDSAKSEQGALGMLLADDGDLVTIPEPCSPPLSEPESCFTSDPNDACPPTQLDDISEEDYAFIDFALSDDFPACHEDEIVPPLNISLKKSDSLLNLLNVQMVF